MRRDVTANSIDGWSSDQHTYHSTQSAALPVDSDTLDSRADPDALMRMLQSYFLVAQQSAGGVVRIRWSAGRPRFALLASAVTLIGMGEPRFERGAHRGAISLDVVGGLLVRPGAKPRLVIALLRKPGCLEASVALLDYEPRGGQYPVVRWVYRQTQARVHAWVGLRYLHQLYRQWGDRVS